MILEERYIISLIRGNNYDFNDYKDIDRNKVIELLQNQKIFLQYFDKIIKCPLFIENIDKISYIQKKYIDKRKKYLDFLKELIETLNELNIEYYLYKGTVLETMIYSSNNKRQYDDIDIYIPNYANLDDIINKLKNNFPSYKDLRKKIMPLLGEEKVSIKYFNQIYTIEFKTKYHFSKFINNKPQNLLCSNITIPTFSYEDTLILLMQYYKEFTRNIEFLRLQKKIKLQYATDLYNFIKKYGKNLNWKYLFCILKAEPLFIDVKGIFLELEELFFDYSLKKLLLLDEDDCLKQELKFEILDIIPIYERFFNNEKICDFIIKYCLDIFWFNNNPKYDFTKIGVDDETSLLKSFNFVFLDQYILKMNVQLKKPLETNDVIFLNLFGYRMSGEFINPFIPITIRRGMNENILSLYFAPRSTSYYDFSIENDYLLKDEYENSIVVDEKENELNIVIHLDKLPHKINYNKKIGINIYTYQLEGFLLKHSWCYLPYFKQPLLLKGEK